MHRTKEQRKFWLNKITTLFAEQTKSQLTENRFKAVYAVMLPSFPWIKDIEQEQFIHMLDTASWLEREMRRETEGMQQELKVRLSQEKVVELYH